MRTYFSGKCRTTKELASQENEVKPHCLSGFYGVDCQEVCTCQNGGVCDSEKGE